MRTLPNTISEEVKVTLRMSEVRFTERQDPHQSSSQDISYLSAGVLGRGVRQQLRVEASTSNLEDVKLTPPFECFKATLALVQMKSSNLQR